VFSVTGKIKFNNVTLIVFSVTGKIN